MTCSINVRALTGMALLVITAGCASDPAAAGATGSPTPSTTVAPQYDCPQELPFDVETGFVPPEGSRIASEAEFRQADLTGFTGCGWVGDPAPRISSSSDRLKIRETQTRTADQLGQPVPHDGTHVGLVYIFHAVDGTTYVVGSATQYGRGDVFEAIYALD